MHWDDGWDDSEDDLAEALRDAIGAARTRCLDAGDAPWRWDADALRAVDGIPQPHPGWELTHCDDSIEVRRQGGLLELCFVGRRACRLGDIDLALRHAGIPPLSEWHACPSFEERGSADTLYVATVPEAELAESHEAERSRHERWASQANESAWAEEEI